MKVIILSLLLLSSMPVGAVFYCSNDLKAGSTYKIVITKDGLEIVPIQRPKK